MAKSVKVVDTRTREEKKRDKNLQRSYNKVQKVYKRAEHQKQRIAFNQGLKDVGTIILPLLLIACFCWATASFTLYDFENPHFVHDLFDWFESYDESGFNMLKGAIYTFGAEGTEWYIKLQAVFSLLYSLILIVIDDVLFIFRGFGMLLGF